MHLSELTSKHVSELLDQANAMEIDGATGDIGPVPQGDREQALMSVLRPDQCQRFQDEQQRRRDEAQKEMSEIGLALPSNWDALEDY